MEDGAYSYRKLVLWEKAQDLTLEIVKIVSRLPNDRVAKTLGPQIIRAASSIAANIAEGHGRYTLGAHRNHLSIAKGSACETDSWLDLLRRAGYLDSETEAGSTAHVRRSSVCSRPRSWTSSAGNKAEVRESERNLEST